MEDLNTSLIVIACTALAIGLIFYLTQRAKRQKMAQIQALAVQQGWGFEQVRQKLISGYRLIGKNWMMESMIIAQGADVEPHLSNIHSYSTFTSEALTLLGRNLLIGPAEKDVQLGEFGRLLQQKVIEKFLGPSGVGVHPVQAGSSTFLQKYLILANEETDVRRILSPKSEAILMGWQGTQPVVKVTGSGLEIRVEGVYLEAPEDIQKFVDLGISFLSAV